MENRSSSRLAERLDKLARECWKLELFLPYDPGDDDESIQAICPDLQAARITGLKLSRVINVSSTIQNARYDPEPRHSEP